MKEFYVDCKVEIGCMCKVRARNEKEAIDIVKESGWDWNLYECDRAHYDIEAEAMPIKKGGKI